jgi:hypothetical protein
LDRYFIVAAYDLIRAAKAAGRLAMMTDANNQWLGDNTDQVEGLQLQFCRHTRRSESWGHDHLCHLLDQID